MHLQAARTSKRTCQGVAKDRFSSVFLPQLCEGFVMSHTPPRWGVGERDNATLEFLLAFRSKGPVCVSACPAWSLVVALSMMSRVPTEADNLHTYRRWSGVEHWPIRWWPVYTVGCFCLNHISEVARLPYLWKCNRRLGSFDGIGLSRSGSTTWNKCFSILLSGCSFC